MNRLAASLSLLGLTAALAACSSDTKPEGAAGKPTPTPSKSAVVLTSAQAKAALPELSELPKGFAADDYSHEDLPLGCPAVDAAVKAEQALKPTYVGATYSKDDSGYSVDAEIGIYPSAEAARSLLLTYQRAFADCPAWKVTEEGVNGTVAVKAESTAGLGDFAMRLALTAEAGGQKFEGSEYVVLVGNTLSFATEGGPLGKADDPALDLAGVISSMVNKLKAA